MFAAMTGHAHTFASPLGDLRVVVDDSGRLMCIDLPGAAPVLGAVEPDPEGRHCARVVDQLREYFAGRRRVFDLQLAPRGTPFQLRAWRALQDIPFGETRSYQQQAAAIGQPSAVRAIGGANGRNPLPIVVPCHRVIGKDGSLVGFGGGLDCKRRLLQHEANVLAGTAGARS